MPLPGDAIPIRVLGREWGFLAAVGVSRSGNDREEAESAQPMLRRYADLLGLGLGNAEGHASLLARATTDPLTGLANHRLFHEKLRHEVARAQRYARPLAVAMLEIDHFKAVNDCIGHRAGDEVLATVATRIAAVMRDEVIVARLGGDELGIILPETSAELARFAIERAQRRLAETSIGPTGTITVSVGICDNTHAVSADRLLELADGALYWAKAHGRDGCVVYTPEEVQELSDAERADRLAQTQARTGLRALAAAIDAKDSATTRHSERVADVVCALARARDWPERRVELLREAALVHDVGKIGVPDAILSLPTRLSPEQYEQVKRHAALGAQIAAEILDAEQVEWILCHHEQPNGRGYPNGRTSEQLSEGAKLLALADAWEAMTSTRAYSRAKSVDAAIDECQRLAGSQFASEAVDALLRAQSHVAVLTAAK
jgi:diguanylate cyclase (GGDEF)-like protein